MSLVVLLVLMVLATALPDLAPPFLSIQRYPPDLWVLATLYLAFRARAFKAVGWAILIGIVRDSVSLDALGTHAFTLGLLAYIFAEGRRSRGRIDGANRVLLTGLGVLLAGWIYLLRLLPVQADVLTLDAFVACLPTALWSAVLAMGLYPLLDRHGLLDELCGRSRAFSS